jgi:predicted DNA-binding transcriptional regulator AlpA
MPKHTQRGKDGPVPFRERITCSVSDAEAATGVSRSQLYLEMKAGRLEYLKRGTRRLIRVPSLLKLLE